MIQNTSHPVIGVLCFKVKKKYNPTILYFYWFIIKEQGTIIYYYITAVSVYSNKLLII